MRRYFIIFLSLSFFQFALSGQEELPDEKFEITKKYRAQVKNASALGLKLSPPEVDTSPVNIVINHVMSPTYIEAETPGIRILKLKSPEPEKTYAHYLRGSIGTKRYGLVHLRGNIEVADDVELSYQPIYRGINNKAIVGMNSSQWEVPMALKFLGNDNLHSWGVGAHVGNSTFGEYRFHSQDTSFRDSMSYDMRSYGVKAFAEGTMDMLNSMEWATELGYRRHEINVKNLDFVNFKLNAALPLTDGLKFNVALKNQYVSQDIEDISDDSNLLHVTPHIRWMKKNLNLDAGLDFAMANDQSYVFPRTYFSMAFFDSRLIPYFSTEGSSRLLSGDIQYLENPYASTSFLQQITVDYVKSIGFGFKGKHNRVNYDLSWVRAAHSALMHFTESDISTLSQSYFEVDTAATTVNTFSAMVQYELKEDVMIRNSFDFRSWDNEEVQTIPNLRFESYVDWNMVERLKLFGNLGISSNYQYEVDGKMIYSSKWRTDLGVGASYQVQEHINVEAEARNVLGNRYDRWYGYERIGTQFIGTLRVRL